jgi:hypothetical protein
MVICNICGENKTLDEIQPSFRYVCKECWDKCKIIIDSEVPKDLFY